MTATLTRPASPSVDTLTMTEPDSLPDSMAEVLIATIGDARSLDPNTYRPRSKEWHTATEEGPCEICLAGSLIAGTFNVSPNRTMFPYMFTADTERKLEALDYMRLGKWALAYKTFYGRRPAPPIEERLTFLPLPHNSSFNGWQEFQSHLDSLESIIPDLQVIERCAHTR